MNTACLNKYLSLIEINERKFDKENNLFLIKSKHNKLNVKSLFR